MEVLADLVDGDDLGVCLLLGEDDEEAGLGVGELDEGVVVVLHVCDGVDGPVELSAVDFEDGGGILQTGEFVAALNSVVRIVESVC